jgi:hypothetical protein
MGWRDQRFDLNEWLFFGLLLIGVLSAVILLWPD